MSIPKEQAEKLVKGDRVYARDPFTGGNELYQGRYVLTQEDGDFAPQILVVLDLPSEISAKWGVSRWYQIDSDNIWLSKMDYDYAMAQAIELAEESCLRAVREGLFAVMSFSELEQITSMCSGEKVKP